jgi:hypothetical protein
LEGKLYCNGLSWHLPTFSSWGEWFFYLQLLNFCQITFLFPFLTCQPPFVIRSTIVVASTFINIFIISLNHAFAPSCTHTYGLPNSPKYYQQLDQVPCLVICAHIDILKRLVWQLLSFSNLCWIWFSFHRLYDHASSTSFFSSFLPTCELGF